MSKSSEAYEEQQDDMQQFYYEMAMAEESGTGIEELDQELEHG